MLNLKKSNYRENHLKGINNAEKDFYRDKWL